MLILGSSLCIHCENMLTKFSKFCPNRACLAFFAADFENWKECRSVINEDGRASLLHTDYKFVIKRNDFPKAPVRRQAGPKYPAGIGRGPA